MTEKTVELMGVKDGQIDLEAALARVATENPQLLILAGCLKDTNPLLAVVMAYEMLRRQADTDWMEENMAE